MGAALARRAPRVRVEEPPPLKVGGALREPWFRPPGSWTMDLVEGALEQHERGDMRESGRLLEALLADEEVASLIGLRIGTVTGLDFGFEPEVPGIMQDWRRMMPASRLDDILFKSLMMGVCLVQDERTSYDDLPSWKPWPADGIRYDYFRRVWQVYTADRGLQDVTPGDGQWAIFEHRFARSWMAGYIRALAPMVIIRQSTLYNWANHAQVYATPSRILKAPQRMSELKDVQRAVQLLRRLVGDSTIVLPEGLSMELLELKGKSTPEIFQRLRDSIGASMQIMLVGQLGTAKAAGGWGSAHTERRVTQQLLERDVQILVDPMHQQVVAPYDAWKRGTRRLEMVPRPCWDTKPAADLDAEAKRQDSVARARLQEAQELERLSKLDFGDGWRVDMVQVAKERGIPLRQLTPEQRPALPAPQQEPALAA